MSIKFVEGHNEIKCASCEYSFNCQEDHYTDTNKKYCYQCVTQCKYCEKNIIKEEIEIITYGNMVDFNKCIICKLFMCNECFETKGIEEDGFDYIEYYCTDCGVQCHKCKNFVSHSECIDENGTYFCANCRIKCSKCKQFVPANKNVVKINNRTKYFCNNCYVSIKNAFG